MSIQSQVAYSTDRANRYIAENMGTVNPLYRNLYHASPPVGWMNDPNGFVQYQGAYHLFYQFHPYDAKWGPMHWGHMKSTDLIHWEALPVALAPDQAYDRFGCFSGSAIERDGKLYLLYTGVTEADEEGVHHQVQCLAVSEDGLHFDKVQQNPVIPIAALPEDASQIDFRDPKVFEHEGMYYTVIASKASDETGQILLYQSEDLVQWEFASVFLKGTKEQGIMWECPDFFRLDGKDCLIFSPMQWPQEGDDFQNLNSSVLAVGEVDWTTKQFHPESYQELDHGLDYYAPQSLEDDKGRRICIGWMQMWGRNFPTDTLGHGWTGSMTIPRELKWVDGQLKQYPIGIEANTENQVESSRIIMIEDAKKTIPGIEGDCGLLQLKVDISELEKLSILLRENENERTVVSFDKEKNELGIDRSASGIVLKGEEATPPVSRKVTLNGERSYLELAIYLDHSSVEVFERNGEAVMTANVYPTEEATGISFECSGKTVFEEVTFTPFI
ncbi:glycoside hydrolase family 32 protein [Trichococcus sp.]|uniref:glycoside hydrolase family 32 protein n=1 Tax=Trichococcus sp. TaxID=1985464 RepID=UPI003C7D8925